MATRVTAGYVVHIGRTTFGTQLYALQALIQSNKQDPVYLDSKIEEFLSEFRQTLVTMPDADFADNVNAVIEELVEKPKNLGEESRQLWASIESGLYAFDLREVSSLWSQLCDVCAALLMETVSLFSHACHDSAPRSGCVRR